MKDNQAKYPQLRFKGFTDPWEDRKLGDLATSFEYGLNASAKEFDGIHKYIRITDIDDSSRKFDHESLTSPDIDLSSADNYKLQYGDILFARTGASVGKTYIYSDSDGLVYYAGFLIRARIKSGVDSNFIFQHTLTSSYENFIRVTSQRSGQPGVNAKEYSIFEISVPSYEEQQRIGSFFKQLDNTIALHQRKLAKLKKLKQGYLQKMFPQNGSKFPQLRFAGFADDWEERKFGELYKKVNEKNDLSFGKDRVISVANMYFKDTDNIRSDDAYMKTYNIFRMGDIAFEGNRSKHFSYGRFVENTIGDGIVSHVFDVFRPIQQFDLNYWKYAIHNERVMGPILMTATTSSTMMTNLVAKDFLKRAILVPAYSEQKLVGSFFKQLDDTIALHQRKLEKLQELKKGYLQKMFC
ncbi:restriction endonuclease subunit S [Levilactobacillus brevis]|uniref:restriction endonuclease subunit S n=1 Tax=Levilactobacillus brevis TaxID=1580 RepID=UPI0009D6216C|nr:restriction endonuclease subunit S [Levilactobacillus brevis]MCT3579797.1 restriction endonuclease subunit S [Levilactobacillus brevis]MCT3583152.1 restriction endonuclease subunit S [Levilactobacillus brevis]OOV21114.1 type I restriction endonuclease subunit S [Levilactobacillus brevis]